MQKEVRIVGTNEKVKRKPGRPKGSKSGYTHSEKSLAQRKAVSPMVEIGKPFSGADEEYNARHIEHIMRIHEIASGADIKDPVSLKSCFINYLMLCQQDGFKIGQIAACAAMGISRMTLHNWLSSNREEYRQLANFVQTTCALSREELIADSKINPVIGIFWQRNFDGLRNDTEQQQTAKETEDSSMETAADYMKKYGKLIEE